MSLIYAITILGFGFLPIRAETFPFVVNATVDKPLQYLPLNGAAYIRLNAAVSTVLNPTVSGSYTYSWVQLQDGLNPRAVNASGSGKAGLNGTTTAAAYASLPIPGVYEFQVTVTDAKNSSFSAIRRTWVNIWDPKPAYNSDPLTVAPGCAAPTTVTPVNSDPGPYQHPRVLCTQADYAAMHARVTGGSAVATQAYSDLVAQTVPALIGSPSVTESPITADLISYMGINQGDLDSPYTKSYPGNPKTLANDISNYAYQNYYLLLWNASYAAWVNPAGAGITLRAVANLSAALAHFHLIQCYNEAETDPTKMFNKTSPDWINGLDTNGTVCGNPNDSVPDTLLASLAIAYDFSYSAMTDAQREDVRKILFATGYNRGPYNPVRGFAGNGDFSNAISYGVFFSLAIDGEQGSVQTLDPNIYNHFNVPPLGATYTFSTASALPTDPTAWPLSNAATQAELQREIWWSMDYNVSPWGWSTEREAY